VTFSAPTSPTTTASFSVAGTYVLRLTASDSALSASDDVQILVSATPNTAPVAQAQRVTTAEDTAVQITLQGSDADGDPLTYGVTGAQHGSLTGTAPSLTYLPAANYAGPDSFTFTVSDGKSAGVSATVSITVMPVNDAPKATAQSRTTAEDTSVTITLQGSDVDGDALTYAIASAPTRGSLSGSGASRTYTPAANYTGADSFTFTVSDGTATSAPATVALTITAVNDAPIAKLTVTPTSGAAPLLITANATGSLDPDGEPITYAWDFEGTPVSGGVTVTHTHTTASPCTVTLTVTDPAGASATAVQTVTVTEPTPLPPVNTAPTVSAGADQTLTLPSTASLSGTVTDDGLPAGAPVTTTWSRLSGPGAVIFSAPTSTTTTASFSVAGTYLLRLTASDSTLSASDDVTLTVQSAPEPPLPGGGVVADWRFEEGAGSLSRDSAGGHTGQLMNGVAWTLGRVGKGLRFDGLDDQVRVGASPALDMTDALSIAFWVKSEDAPATDERWLAKPGSWDLKLNGTTPQFSGGGYSQPNFKVTHGQWVHLVVTFDRGSVAWYVNGAAQTLRTNSFPAGAPLRASQRELMFGSDGSANHAKGVLDEVRLYSRALSAEEVRAVYVEAASIPIPTNQAPIVSAGPDQAITLPASASLTGTVTDDGLPSNTLTTTWSTVSGPTGGTVTFGNASAVDTAASFSVAGTYVLRLTASDGALSASDEVPILVQAAPVAQILTLLTEADARVEAKSPTSNFGDGRLHVDGQPLKESYLRFRVPTVSGTITTATLRLYVSKGSTSRPTLFATGPTWTESTITWNTRPANLGTVTTLPASTTGTWLTVDVTAAVKAAGVYSFGLKSSSGTEVWIENRERGKPAELVLQVQ
jgi:hypothetical protein